ncbi:MAG: type 2 lantipeptide synthetase LanM family protein, partial [Nocardiopsaceae bacterium]|nr:type 2 lantipeptide synthetase LanM family protein [Nocardiopsaceae bacterium]
AARAANLAERIEIVSALEPPPALPPLTAFESRQMDRLVTRLAARLGQEASRRGGTARYSDRALREILGTYRAHQRHLTGPGGRLGLVLADLHRDWLPAYTAALDGLDPLASPGAGWREPDVYYGRLATACEPFLLELGRRLADEAADAAVRVDPRVIEDFQDHLLDRFELALAWAVEADAKVYCAEHGIDAARAGQPEYRKYLDDTFADAASYHRFYLEFPVLGRWLAQVTGLLAEHGRDLIRRLAADAAAVGAAFFAEPVAAVRSVRLGRSDPHAGARGVAIVDLELADGTVAPVVYKPRSVASEAALQGLLARLRDDGAGDFAERGVLPRAGYGYEALIPPGRNRVESAEQARRVYAELGGYLAIFYILGGGDLHLENVLVADGHAFICDCETVLGTLAEGTPHSPGTLMDSVFKTGLIEWPATSADGRMRISGYSGGDAFELPTAVPRVDGRLTFQASVRHRHGVRVEPGAANRVFIKDRLTNPEEFAEAIRSGFDRVYRWFQRSPEPAIECVRALFTGTEVRFINWSTQVYEQLLQAARHPTCLMEPIETDLLFSTVWTFPRNWDRRSALPEWELAAMWRRDIPLFSVPADGRRLTHDHAGQTGATLAKTPLEFAAERITRLSAANRARQHQYIAAALSGGDVTSPEFASTCLEQASRVGQRLCAMLREPGAPAPWTSYVIGADGRTEVDIEADLYLGSAGVALFLAYLNDLDPRPEFDRAARRALDHALATWDRRRIGAFTGLGGMIYLLTHLHRLWGERDLLDHARRLAEDLPRRIPDDRHLDVFHGVAGLIPVLLGLERSAGHGLELAHQCAAHLLRRAEADGPVLSWPGQDTGPAEGNLTGFSHGAGGIGWALIALGAEAGRQDYLAAGRSAFAYEARHFDPDERDWYDLRVMPGGLTAGGRHYANAWCNGAAGIGLSRIDAWARLGKGDDDLLTEAYQALSATLRNFPRLGNDSLCHGRSGNAELFLRFAALKDEPGFRLEANVQARSLWSSLDEASADERAGFFPGLMLGLAGFGMHLLRLASPGRVPSVLLLDPPTIR